MFQKTMAFTLKFSQHSMQRQAELLSLGGWGQPDGMAQLPMGSLSLLGASRPAWSCLALGNGRHTQG